MKVSFIEESFWGVECIIFIKVEGMKVIGQMVNMMGMVLRYGFVVVVIEGNIVKVCVKVMVFIVFIQGMFIQVIG